MQRGSNFDRGYEVGGVEAWFWSPKQGQKHERSKNGVQRMVVRLIKI